MAEKRLAGPIKPNLICVVLALLAMAWLSVGLYEGALDVVPLVLGGSAEADGAADGGGGTLAADIAEGDTRGALIQLLLHIIGGQLLLPVVAGLVAMGVKLLDEKPADAPPVPAATHERVVADLLAAQRAADDRAVAAIEREARQPEERP